MYIDNTQWNPHFPDLLICHWMFQILAIGLSAAVINGAIFYHTLCQFIRM